MRCYNQRGGEKRDDERIVIQMRHRFPAKKIEQRISCIRYIYIEHNKCHAFERIQNIYRVPNELFQLLESLRNLFYTFIIVHTRKRALTIFIGFIDDFS